MSWRKQGKSCLMYDKKYIIVKLYSQLQIKNTVYLSTVRTARISYFHILTRPVQLHCFDCQVTFS
jgi:hypothetical protein